jgi:DNA-binding MarR family transcriptional regulator
LALAGRLRRNARQAQRGDNLSAAGRGVLLALHLNGPLTVPQLAVQRSTSRQNIQVLVNRLASTGFVDTSPNPHHKRSELIRLTETGEMLLQSANQREAAMLVQLIPNLDEADVLAAADLLRKTRELLSGKRPNEAGIIKKREGITSSRAAHKVEDFASPEPSIEANTPVHAEVEATVPDEEEMDELPVNLL